MIAWFEECKYRAHAISELVMRHSAAAPLRWAVGGTILVAGVGFVYGIAESVRDIPASSWFGVTLYVSLPGAVAGFVLGIIAGGMSRLL